MNRPSVAFDPTPSWRERVDVEHTVTVGVDADGALELRDVGLPLAAHVDAEGLVDVVLELRDAAGVLVLAVVAGVDHEAQAEDHDHREHPREQEAAGLTRRHPAAGPGRASHLLGRGCLTHRVAHPTRGAGRDPFRPAGAHPRPGPVGRARRSPPRWPPR